MSLDSVNLEAEEVIKAYVALFAALAHVVQRLEEAPPQSSQDTTAWFLSELWQVVTREAASPHEPSIPEQLQAGPDQQPLVRLLYRSFCNLCGYTEDML